MDVEPGERVAVGQRVGRCGNSGNSSEPHLHYQLQDSPGFFTAMSLPPAFSGVELRSADGRASEATPDDDAPEHRLWAYLRRGQRVRYVTEGAGDEAAEDGSPAVR